MQWIVIGYILMSTVTFVVYGWDKRAALRRTWRVPESTLQLLALIGGFPGALVAQQMFRHKCRKLRFMIAFWLIVVLHMAAWVWWLAIRDSTT